MIMTEKECKHAGKVSQNFGYVKLAEYHDVFLNIGTLILACLVFCYRTGLGYCLHFICYHLSCDAFVKPCQVNTKLLTSLTFGNRASR